MAINQKRMGGRFMVTPFEVYDILYKLPWPCAALYASILRFQYVHEDWESDDTWVVGSVKAKRKELFDNAPIGEATFYRTAWPGLVDAGLIDDTSEVEIILPKLKKKADIGISPADLAELRSRVEQLEAAQEPDEDPDEGSEKGGQTRKEAEASAAEGNPSRAEGNPSAAEASSRARESLSGDLDIDKIYEEEEGASSPSQGGQEKGGKILTFRGKGQKNFLTDPYKKLIAELENIWPGRGVKLPQDADYLVALHGFPDAALAEALQAAKENKIKYGNFDWILSRLQNPELFIHGKKRKKKSGEWDPDIGRLEADWLNVN